MALDTLSLKELQEKRQTIKNQLATVRGPEAEVVKTELEDIEDLIRIRQDHPSGPVKPKEPFLAPVAPGSIAPRSLDKNSLRRNEDWVGNNAAFTCPSCNQVFLVSGMIHRNGRSCPNCGQFTGRVDPEGATATLELTR